MFLRFSGCLFCLCFLSVFFFVLVRTDEVRPSVHWDFHQIVPSVTFNNSPRFSVCLFVCVCRLIFFLSGTDGRSPSAHIEISIRCHRSRLINLMEILTNLEISILQMATPGFLCLFVCVCPSHFFWFCTERSPSVRTLRHQIVPSVI
jgi:hypothetical protein